MERICSRFLFAGKRSSSRGEAGRKAGSGPRFFDVRRFGMEKIMITAAGNSRIKHLVQLSQKARERKKEDVFLVEGMKMFLEAPREKIREVYVSESFLEQHGFQAALKGLPWELVSDEVFRKISDTITPQGVLCVMQQFHYNIEEMLSKKAPLLMLLEEIQDPGNLGTIVRTGEGAGIDGIIMSRETVDIYNPKTIRATMGSIYRVPFLYADSLEATIADLKDRGVRTFAAHLKGKNWHDGEDYRGGTAFLIGNEGNGLKEQTAKLADCYIRIPMAGQVESLNAAVASSILMYEAGRQRRWERE